jgi:hypothetical protein
MYSYNLYGRLNLVLEMYDIEILLIVSIVNCLEQK